MLKMNVTAASVRFLHRRIGPGSRCSCRAAPGRISAQLPFDRLACVEFDDLSTAFRRGRLLYQPDFMVLSIVSCSVCSEVGFR